MKCDRWDMWGQKTAAGFMHVGSRHFCRLSAEGCPDPIVPVDVVEEDHGLYYGWMYADEDVPAFIFSSEALLDMCFPYGLMCEVEHGRGRVLRLTIREKQQ